MEYLVINLKRLRPSAAGAGVGGGVWEAETPAEAVRLHFDSVLEEQGGIDNDQVMRETYLAVPLARLQAEGSVHMVTARYELSVVAVEGADEVAYG